MISMQYGSVDNYYHLNLSMIWLGIKKFITGFTSSYFFIYSLAVLGSLFILFLLFVFFSKRGTIAQRRKILYISLATFFSLLIYSLIIACVPHYHMNLFSPRYFIFDVFLILFILSFNFSICLRYFYKNTNKSFAVCVLIFCCSLLFFVPNDFNIRNARVYKNCDEIIPAGTHFYVGDYWKIWACMSRDLNDGYDSRSLGVRSLTDKQNILKKLRSASGDGVLEISCLNSEIEMCKNQIGEYYSAYHIKELQQINPHHIKLVIGDLVEKF